VSIQAFVEGLLRLANVLEATHWTLQTVNNICTLAIYSTTYVLLFSGDLTGIRWQVEHMSTRFVVFVSTGVNIAIVVLGLRKMCNMSYHSKDNRVINDVFKRLYTFPRWMVCKV
jgi:hypothetical protein